MKKVSKKRKDRDEVEELQKKIRELKSLNRSLHRQLKKINKGYRRIRDDEDSDEPEIIVVKPEIKVCYECERGVMEKITIMNRYFRKCTNCNNRTKVKFIK